MQKYFLSWRPTVYYVLTMRYYSSFPYNFHYNLCIQFLGSCNHLPTTHLISQTSLLKPIHQLATGEIPDTTGSRNNKITFGNANSQRFLITPEWTEGFYPNLTRIFYTTVRRTDQILKIEGQGQGRYKVKYLSQLLWQMKPSMSMVGLRSII